MTNVEVVESLKYGFKLFVYLLGVVVLGGGGMVLGTALAGPELLDGVTGNLSSPELLGGLVLATLGVTIWFTGTFGLTYKLLADAVQWGVSSGTRSSPAPEQESSGQPAHSRTHQSVEPIGPSPGEQTAREFGPESTVPSASDVPDRRPSESSATTASQPGPAGDGQSESPAADGPPRESELSSASEGPAGGGNSPTEEPVGDERGRTDDSGGKQERTAEQIAFGTGEEGQPDRRTEGENGSDEQGSQEEGSIPPYEAMDESQPETAEETGRATLPYETDEDGPEEGPGLAAEDQPSSDTEPADQFSETPSDVSETPPGGETETDESAIPFESAGGDDADENDSDESGFLDDETDETQTDPLSEPLDDDT